MTKKDIFLANWVLAVRNTCYYDRKHCDELSVRDVENLIGDEEVSLKEILFTVEKELRDNYPHIKES